MVSSLSIFRFLLALTICSGLIFAGLTYNVFDREKNSLNNDLDLILTYLQALDLELFATSSVLEIGDADLCSLSSLDNLRLIEYGSTYITDIAILDDAGHRRCSTTLGIVEKRDSDVIFLDPDLLIPTLLSEGSPLTSFYVGADAVLGVNEHSLMVANPPMVLAINSRLLLSRAGAYSEVALAQIKGDMLHKVFTPSSNDTILDDPIPLSQARNGLRDTLCLPGGDVCVYGTRDPKLIWQYAGVRLVFSIIIGAGVSLLVMLLLARYLEQQGSMKNRLLRAIERKDLFVVYQPLVNLHSGTVESVEALVRWIDLDGQFINPEHFCSVAEDAGISDQLTRYVMDYTATHFWSQPELNCMPVGFNISPREMIAEDFIEALSLFAATHQLGKNLIKVEVTERVTVSADALEIAMAKISQAGFDVAIDDFGTGHSSFPYLSRLKISAIKLDKSFVQAVGEDNAYALMLPHLVEMLRALKVPMVIEGVETAEQRDWFADKIEAVGQGWHFARPQKADAIVATINELEGKCSAHKAESVATTEVA